MRYALIDKKTTKIVNVVVWDGDETKWKPPGDFDIKPLPRELKFGIDDFYDYDKKEYVMNLEREGQENVETIDSNTDTSSNGVLP